ncbi:MAG: hypothetical protein GY803_24105, partial [Chloroflexi bacterium]|nr:hypothetical protein [Chloroflexota bacterium]
TVTMENALETAVSELGKALQARYAQVEIMPAAHPTREETAVLPGNDSNGGKQT